MYPAPADGRFKVDRYPLVTEYLRSLPKDALVAGPPADLDFVPTFAQRPILAGFQYAVAFHHGYYDQLRRRLDDLIAAYYAEDLREVMAFAARYRVAVFLVDRGAFQLTEFEEGWTGVGNTPWEPF